jgi:hypothetical protein
MHYSLPYLTAVHGTFQCALDFSTLVKDFVRRLAKMNDLPH